MVDILRVGLLNGYWNEQLTHINTHFDDAHIDLDSNFYALIPKVYLNQNSIKHLNLGIDRQKNRTHFRGAS